MKKYIVVTGGAGFVGSNLIEYLLKKTNFKILSVDNYSSGFLKNHIKHKKVKYIKSDTNNIEKCLETEEAKLILNNGYRAVGCAVITFFFVREEDISE